MRTYQGSGPQIGWQIGRDLADRLPGQIQRYLSAAEREYGLNRLQLEESAESWLERLPDHYREEVEALAQGAGSSLSLVAGWIFADRFFAGGCTSFLYFHQGEIWVGRNNDYIAPGLWNQVTVLEKDGDIPLMIMGLEGELFSGTGYNREKLWIHYNHLPLTDAPPEDSRTVPPFVFVREALATCRTLEDVETVLADMPRDGGMNLFVVDGKSRTWRVFECASHSYVARKTHPRYIVGANHRCTGSHPPAYEENPDSRQRQQTAEKLLERLDPVSIPQDLMQVLGNPGVARACGEYGTVYACLSCPGQDEIWVACDGFPAPAQSPWYRVDWPQHSPPPVGEQETDTVW